jgi:hypothetical protein
VPKKIEPNKQNNEAIIKKTIAFRAKLGENTPRTKVHEYEIWRN